MHHDLSVFAGPDRTTLFGDLRRANAAGLWSRFYLREIFEEYTCGISALCELADEAYLSGHVVRGRPTLLGAFVLEMAAEAALALRPGVRITGFTGLVLHRFMSLQDGRTAVKRIEGRLNGSEVAVTVSGDVVAPDGRVLVHDRVDAEVPVRLADDLGTVTADLPAVDGLPLTAGDSGPLALTGRFASLHDVRAGTLGRWARFGFTPGSSWPAGFVTPALLIDAAVQLGLGAATDEVAVPQRIARIICGPVGADAGVDGALLFAEKGSAEGRSIAAGSVTAVDAWGRLLVRLDGTVGGLLAAPAAAPDAGPSAAPAAGSAAVPAIAPAVAPVVAAASPPAAARDVASAGSPAAVPAAALS
ncbi:polyketide synthase dehydratase domain-containing protein [Lentzea jiangxiensis]|uniref:Polyketide synthase dehydratase n=1 Tax=Lentzea jiangxiensis TaxID=641025 RepID=A0A1H0X4I9_9PSEU|nr:polyketide synthase dehydratase domain-containing protein [Lentzea jiangxiensis]SDP97396.1 Polyketide synthase dehydratase [Lentzea jiangxiensis]